MSFLRRLPVTRVAIIALLGVINVLLLTHYNTLTWPYLWPQPMLYVFLGAFAVLMWFPELMEELALFRIVGALMLFIGQSYVLHSVTVVITDFSFIALIHATGVTGTFLVMVLNYINQFSPKNQVVPPPMPDDLPYVAAVIPTYGEPVEILENTLRSLIDMEYPRDRLYVFISDDGHREEVRQLTARMGAHYNQGAQKDAKAGNLNSALQHIEEHFPQATLILTQDADEIIDPTFLAKTVGYFVDEQIGFVQTPKEALAPDGDPFGVRDRVFYDVTQPGRNGSGAAFSCGSGVLWRIKAVQSIGGYDTWNIVEDLTTSYKLHSAGWKSDYYNEILTIGLAPDDIPGLLKQRGTWATDNWRLFLFKNPLFNSGLTWAQRLQYAELGMFYMNSVIFIPLIMLTPVFSLLTGIYVPIEGAALFPWLLASLLYYYVFSRGNLHYFSIMLRYWISHFWTYTRALWIAVRSKNHKPSYKVTSKTRQDGFHGKMLIPQFAYVILSLIAIIRGLFFMPNVDIITRLTNVSVTAYFVFLTWSICGAAFYGVQLPTLQPVARLAKMLRTAWQSGEPVSQQPGPTN